MKEMGELEARGIPVRERLLLSEACPLILPYHVALDNARETRGAKAIGTTGRGIGPAYEDKVARRGLRVSDLFNKETFAVKLKRSSITTTSSWSTTTKLKPSIIRRRWTTCCLSPTS